MKSSSSSVSANILSFDGLKHLRQLQYSKLNKKVAALQYEKAKHDLYLNITAYFLETLCAKENIGNCKNIVESLQKQEEQISIKVGHGKVTIADLLQIQARLADAENTLLSAKHNYDLSRMNLRQFLELKDYKTFVPNVTVVDSIEYCNFSQTDILNGIIYT